MSDYSTFSVKVGDRVKLVDAGYRSIAQGETVTVETVYSDGVGFTAKKDDDTVIDGCAARKAYWELVPNPVTHETVMPPLATLPPSVPVKDLLPKRLLRRAAKLATASAASRSQRKALSIATYSRSGLSIRQIAKKLGLSKSAVGRVIQRIAA
jgi:hypothetical protein